MTNRSAWYFLLLFLLQSCMSPGRIVQYWQMRDEAEKKNIQLNEVTISNKKMDYSFPNKIIDILHTNIEVSFLWSKQECIGKAEIILKPYYYNTDSIVLDAHFMTINGLSIKNQNQEDLQYALDYNKEKLKIKLDRTVTKQDTLTVVINYIAKPSENNNKTGKAIRDQRGLYFINTNNIEPHKPQQIWTQGEPEANSGWFPTIDHPSEKFTSTITISANKDFTFLSNGTKTKSVIEGNTKTETWENNKPLPAYLLMMTIAELNVTEELNTPIPINYYLEKKYSPLAKQIFKSTPEMLDFFSNKLDIPYPWSKYSQVVVRDYVSGAMENASATLHGDFVQKNERELVDGDNEDIIAHELFHQWFGNLVTCKTWSHITLNEGFANYGEQLWKEYKYGQDAGLKKSMEAINRYLNYAKNNSDDPIINYTYKIPDDVFNTLTYQKGSRVIHLLRKEVGDDAFFAVLKNYLKKYEFSNADIDDLRKEFELVTGRDFHPFFKQWFYKGGHPAINIRYNYIDSSQMVAVIVEQTQPTEVGIFKFPLEFKIKDGNLSKTYTFDIYKKREVFYVKKLLDDKNGFPNIIVDPHAIFIGGIVDNKPFYYHVKTLTQAPNYVEKYRSLMALASIQNETDTARKTLLQSLSDKDEHIRAHCLNLINWNLSNNYTDAKENLIALATKDNSAMVRAKATKILAEKKDPNFMSLFTDLSKDKSYTVAANALSGLYKLVPIEGIQLCQELKQDARGPLLNEIGEIYSASRDTNYLSYFTETIPYHFGQERATLINQYTNLVMGINTIDVVNKGVNYLFGVANKDGHGFVRYTAMMSLHNIQNTLANYANQTKDKENNALIQNLQTTVKEKLINAIDYEQDEYVLGLLKLQGYTKSLEAEN